MPQLIWSPQALSDVQRLYRLKRAVKAIRQGVSVLGHQPGVGRPMEDMEPPHLEWLVEFGDSGYVLLYRLAADEVVILAVRHQREVGY